MQEWIDNGAELAWLIDPNSRLKSSKISNCVTAGPPVEGFTLQLARVWDPLG